jgi:hypothetical protein
MCFNFLWKGSLDYKRSHLANWKSLSKPKALGGWGLKDGVMFGQELEAKFLWVFLTQESLYRKFIIAKYISPLFVVDWIHQRNKIIPNASTQWRDLPQVFPMIVKYLDWKIGSGEHVRIGSNTIVICGERVFLEEELKFSF